MDSDAQDGSVPGETAEERTARRRARRQRKLSASTELLPQTEQPGDFGQQQQQQQQQHAHTIVPTATTAATTILAPLRASGPGKLAPLTAVSAKAVPQTSLLPQQQHAGTTDKQAAVTEQKAAAPDPRGGASRDQTAAAAVPQQQQPDLLTGGPQTSLTPINANTIAATAVSAHVDTSNIPAIANTFRTAPVKPDTAITALAAVPDADDTQKVPSALSVRLRGSVTNASIEPSLEPALNIVADGLSDVDSAGVCDAKPMMILASMCVSSVSRCATCIFRLRHSKKLLLLCCCICS
jgi:hypothetical protein